MLEKVKYQNTQMRKSITHKRLRRAMLEKVEGQKTQTRKASEAGPLACAAGQDYEITQMRKPRVAIVLARL